MDLLRRRFLLLALFFGFFLLIGKAYYDTNAIEIKHYEIRVLPLSKTLGGLKIALLTDLHIRNIDTREKKILEILDEEKPDLIFLSGDYITFKGEYEPVLSFFRQLNAPYGIYGVFGNTEYTNENGSCVLCHQKGSKRLQKENKPIFLRNTGLVFEVDHKKVNLVGVDDPVKGKSDLKKALQGLDSNLPTVLLAHSPEIFEEAASQGIDLLLCGHNHGGQLFLTRILRDILPLDPTLEFLEGFFQKGKTLMYVSRGIGTSLLPFRFGVKPEITFFKFTNGMPLTSNLQLPAKVDPSNPTNPSDQTAARQHLSTNNLFPTGGYLSSTVISNHPSQTIFAGLTLHNLLETFNVIRIFNLTGLVKTPPPSPLTPYVKILFDFESAEELNRLNWECHKWYELSEENATSGKYSLKVLLPPGQYPGIHFGKIVGDWSKASYLKMDLFNPSEERIPFHIRIDDHKSGWEYANRFDTNFILEKGMNHISLPTTSIKTNIHRRPLNLKRIERLMVFIPDNSKRREFFIDNIRLE